MSDILLELGKDKIIEELREGKRLDGRAVDAYRPIEIIRGITMNADGSARVRLGKTDVIAGTKMVPGEPYPDALGEGTISVGVELLALASPEFDVGPPDKQSIELARVVDRGIRESKALDFSGLCIREGELVWVVFIDVYVMNHDGNLFDAAGMAALVSLLETKLPKLEDDKVVAGEHAGKLKVARKPILTTFAKIGSSLVADPSLAEESAMDARFTLAATEDNYLSAFQKGGGGAFTAEEISRCIDIGMKNVKEIRKLL